MPNTGFTLRLRAAALRPRLSDGTVLGTVGCEGGTQRGVYCSVGKR